MTSDTSLIKKETSDLLLEELQSWWEIPSTAQYISLFRESFQLPEIDIEELEKGFIEDTVNGPNKWLQDLIYAFLRTILPGRVNPENWEIQLRKLINRKWPVDKENPFTEDTAFHQLGLRTKVEIVYSLCLYRLDRNDIPEVMKSMDADALRVQKLGSDEAGNTYWYFYGTRLYKEEAVEEKRPWNEEWNKQKKQSFKKRGRGRPRKVVLNSEGECDDFDDSYKKNDGFMNVSEKSRWSVVCDTIEEWVNFAEKFKDSKSKDEKNLFLIIQENFLPTLNKIYEEKEKKLQQKIKELMPAREKIITRRETRKMRGEVIESPINGYEISDEAHKVHMIKDRARRLEERNKRASEVESYNNTRKRVKNDAPSPEVQSIDKDGKATLLQKTSGRSMDLQCQVERLMSSVKLHKDAWPFLYAVSEEEAPAYYDIIKEPVDLSLIESRLFEGSYETIGDLDADFDRMVSNCELYNGEYHGFSDMARTLRKTFRKGLAKILESFSPEELAKAVESEESRDSNYQSSSSSSSPPREVAGVPSKRHKKQGEKRKKGRIMDALELLAHASDLAVQNSNSNDMLNVSYVHDEEKKSNDFPSLKILPIHSHPPSVVEKFSSSAPKESTSENNNSNENCSTYVNQEVELDGQYVRSSPGSTDIDGQYMRPSPTVSADNSGQSVNSSPTGIDITGQYVRSSPTNIDINGQYVRTSSTGSASSESSNYMNNLTHFTNLIEKNGTKNLNVLSNTDVTNVLSESSPNHETNDNSSVNDSSNAPKVLNSDNLHGFDNILEDYNENFISNLIKQPTYNSGVVLQSKDSVSPSYTESYPHHNLNISKNKEKSSPASSFLGQAVTDNVPLIQDMPSLGNSSSHLTTIDASVLDIQYNPFSKNSKNQDVPLNQNSFTNPNVIPNLAHEGVFSKNNSFRPKERTPPSLVNQYYPQQQSSSILSCDPSVSVPMTYQSLNLIATTSGHTAFAQTLASNSTSNVPLQIPVPCPKPMLSQQQQQQQPKIQFQVQDNSGVRVPVPEQNSRLIVVPEVGKGPVTTYHMFTQNKPSQNVVENHNNHLRNGITAANQMPPNSEKRIIENQDNYTKQGSPPEKKSPSAQHVQTYVPLTSMPYHPASTSTSNISKISLPVTSSNFMPVNSAIQGAKMDNPLPIRTNVGDVGNRTTSVGNTTSFSTISSTNTSNTIPQSNFQALNTQSVPVIFPGYNHSSDQMDSRLKNNPTVTVQSNVGVPNGVPIVQKVLIPQIQYANNGQFLFASPQNTVRLINKEQNVQVQQNNMRQINPNFGKVVPQIVTPTTLMSGLQLQAVAPNNAQTFNQVSQNPQFVSIPTFMLSNHNTLQNTQQSSPPSVMNLQPFQLAQRQMNLNGPGNT